MLTIAERIPLTFIESSNESSNRRQRTLGITRAIAAAEDVKETSGYIREALLMGYGLGAIGVRAIVLFLHQQFEPMPSILTIKSLILSTARSLGIVVFLPDLRSTLTDLIAQRFSGFNLRLQTLHTHSKDGIIQLTHALVINQAG